MAVKFREGRIIQLVNYCDNDMEAEALGNNLVLLHPHRVGDTFFGRSRLVFPGVNYCDQDMEGVDTGDIVELPVGDFFGDTQWQDVGRFV